MAARVRVLGALGALYVAQGLSFGFFTQALPVMLRQRGASLEDIGLSSLLMLPWAGKALWAPWVERHGAPRQWALGLSLGMAALLVAIGALDPATALGAVMAGVLLVNVLAATQDVATDGLAVAVLDPTARGWGNGLQVGAYRVGMIVGGGLLLVVYDRIGWTVSLGLLGAIGAAMVLPLLGVPGLGAARSVPSSPARLGWDWLGRAGALRWLAILVAFKGGDYLVTGMVRPWLVDQGWDASELGGVLGILGFVAGLVGAAVGGWLVGRMDRVVALVLFGALQSAALGVYALVATLELGGAWILGTVVAEHLMGGMATVALFTAMMDASRADRGATDYTIQSAVVVLASGVAAASGGFVAERLGYALTFQIGAALSVLAPALAAVPLMSVITRLPDASRGGTPTDAASGAG